jgi:hypothetical protein
LRRAGILAGVLALVVGCGGGGKGADGAARDGAADAAVEVGADADAAADATASDATALDSAASDGSADAASTDGATDAAARDAAGDATPAGSDAAASDAGQDTGQLEAGGGDTSLPEAGTEAGAGCGASCDDGVACTKDSCAASAGACVHPALVGCSEPQLEAVCALQTGAPGVGSCGVGHDADGDGLSDEWEAAGGIDFDCDGTVTPDERVLSNFDPVWPDGVTSNPHPSAEVNRKDVFLRYDYMQVTGSGTACTTASDCGGHCSVTWSTTCGSTADCPGGETCTSDQYCVGHCSANTAKACNTAADCVGVCSVSGAACGVDADCGNHCSTTTSQVCRSNMDCPITESCVSNGETCEGTGETCVATACTGHSDAPSAAALQMVIDRFDLHGITLHISPVHRVLPHSKVITFGPPRDGCAAPAGHLGDVGRAVDFYSLKPAETLAGGRERPFIHYVVFGHLHTCDSAAHCNNACPPNPDTGALPKFRESGLSEIVGNDMIVTYGATYDGNAGKRVVLPDILLAGTFMHELGHNLGLDHGGPVGHVDSALNYKPNYLSVMNYSFQKIGIGTANASCAPGDNYCRTTATSVRVDYSDAALAPLDETHLDETVGVASGTNDITIYYCPSATFGAGNGPINWDCDTDKGTETMSAGGAPYVEIDNNGSQDTAMNGYDDWSNLSFKFQCDANGHFGDGAAATGIAP